MRDATPPSTQDAEKEKEHFIKAWPVYFESLASGKKTFEVRKNDRDYRVGDILDIHEFDPEEGGGFSGSSVTRKVSYVLNGGMFGIEAGYVVMALEDLGNETPAASTQNTVKGQKEILPCPFCGVIPSVKTDRYAFSMGTLLERADGSKYDPESGSCYTTEFRCCEGCPAHRLSIHGHSPNPKAFLDRVDRSKTEEQIKSEAVSAWNKRAAPSVSDGGSSSASGVSTPKSSSVVAEAWKSWWQRNNFGMGMCKNPCSWAFKAGFKAAFEIPPEYWREKLTGMKAIPFLHRSMVPIHEADLRNDEDRGQQVMFGNECEGMRGV